MEVLALVLFAVIFILILKGYPVAFTLGGLSVLFAIGISIFAPDQFSLSIFNMLPSRIMGVVNNYVLMAVPLFIFMGIMLEKSGLAQSLLETMAMMFGSLRGRTCYFSCYCRSLTCSFYRDSRGNRGDHGIN